MADRKERFALVSLFEKHCKTNGMTRPVLNKNKEQWAADALLESFTFDELSNAMQYYFMVNARPTWSWYSNNVDKIISAEESSRQDKEFRAEMRQKAREWLSESRG
jgi:hypothetical protein